MLFTSVMSQIFSSQMMMKNLSLYVIAVIQKEIKKQHQVEDVSEKDASEVNDMDVEDGDLTKSLI